MKIEFINTTESDFLAKTLIHKFLPIEYALDMLRNKYLWFANPMEWKDPFEKRFIEAEYSGKQFTWRDRVFCTCLTGTSTSEAFWNTYPNGDIGIQLRIRREALLQSLNDFILSNPDCYVFIGKIEYKKTSEITTKPLSAIPFNPLLRDTNTNSRYFKSRLLLLKRVAFQFENEYRIVIVKKKKTKEHGVKMQYSIKNEDLIDTILLDPNLKPNMVSLLKSAFGKLLNDKSKVHHSQLYRNYIQAKY